MVLILLPGAWPARGQTAETGQALRPCLQTAQMLQLEQYLASTHGAPDSYAKVAKTAFDSSPGDAIHMTAFEENPSFVYAVAGIESHESRTPEGRPAGKITRWVRRLIILNSSAVILDDEILSPSSLGTNPGCISSPTAPQVSGHTAKMGKISSQILFPINATYRVMRAGQGQTLASYEALPQYPSPDLRSLQILNAGETVHASGALRAELIPTNGSWKLNATVGDRIYHLTLPPPAEAAGEIAIATLDGTTLVSSRPFPSGVLPHGPTGNHMMEYWDSAYRGSAPPRWDIGRPEEELQKVVAGGKVGRCRVVDMCCGSGTDAVYLASQGFDVTAIDISPTALGQGQRKAHDANVSVQWVLADILAPPDLKPFDFLYDRACYHAVRKQNLQAYLGTVRRFSHPGTDFLLLSFRLDEISTGGDMAVTEEELHADFLTLFDFEWLRKIRLGINQGEVGPPAWSVFLKRNAAP